MPWLKLIGLATIAIPGPPSRKHAIVGRVYTLSRSTNLATDLFVSVAGCAWQAI